MRSRIDKGFRGPFKGDRGMIHCQRIEGVGRQDGDRDHPVTQAAVDPVAVTVGSDVDRTGYVTWKRDTPGSWSLTCVVNSELTCTRSYSGVSVLTILSLATIWSRT